MQKFISVLNHGGLGACRRVEAPRPPWFDGTGRAFAKKRFKSGRPSPMGSQTADTSRRRKHSDRQPRVEGNEVPLHDRTCSGASSERRHLEDTTPLGRAWGEKCAALSWDVAIGSRDGESYPIFCAVRCAPYRCGLECDLVHFTDI